MRILGVLFLVAIALAKRRYDNYQLWSITPSTVAEVEYVRQLEDEVDFWSHPRAPGQSIDVLVSPHRLDELQKVLTIKGISYDILINNYQEVLDKEDARLSKKRAFDVDDFNTLDDIYNQLDVWAANCPEGFDCDVITLGQSLEGRDIKMLQVERGNRPTVWIDSLIHCREWVAGSTHLHFINRLIEEYDTDEESQEMMDNYNFYFVPVMNPDGYEFTWSDDRLWRKNRRENEGSECFGVDLNRNFDAYWDTEGGASDNPCSNTFRGPSPASEPEIDVIQGAIDNLDLDIVVTIHTKGYMWMHAWGWQDEGGNCVRSPDHDDQYDVATAAAEASMAVYGDPWTWGNLCETIYAASGNTVDYAYLAGCKYAYTPELRGEVHDAPVDDIEPAYRETWAGLVALIRRAAEIESW